MPQSVQVDFKSSKIVLPKFGSITAIFHRKFNGKIKTCTVSRNPSGKYFCSVLVDDSLPLPAKSGRGKVIGIDLGIKHFLTDSNGNKINNPKYYNQELRKIRKIQQKLSVKTKGSANYSKLRLRLARLHERICNKRDDFLHKLSSEIINDNQVIITEDLAISDLQQKSHKNLARNIGDVSWSRFISMLKYKADWKGKMMVQIDRFEPSSKKCSACGCINEELRLRDRKWICKGCGNQHDRDVNAAINVLHIGLGRPDVKALRASAQ